MKRLTALLLALVMLLGLTACGGPKPSDADANKLVVWHDKEDAVVEALSAYLAEAVPDLEIVFEKRPASPIPSSWWATTPPPPPTCSSSPMTRSAFLPRWVF